MKLGVCLPHCGRPIEVERLFLAWLFDRYSRMARGREGSGAGP